MSQTRSRAVCSAIACRSGALIARYGGEEIIALLVGRTRTEADEIAQRVVAGVSSLNLAHVAPTDGSRVTISIGVATTGVEPGSRPDSFTIDDQG